ncbi:kinase-like protein [Stipitochalara longipes BDJ]|nr:kinase-like protein [Stipitochalara longipes BDJ]
MATKAAGAATASSDRKKRVHVTINNNAYQRLECIGRCGSCRVYRVMSENFKIWALKKVSLADVDEQAVRGFKGEIELLRRLSKVDRVVQLRDWEVNEAKQTLSVLMEFGEVDLDTILKRHIHSEHPKFDAGFTQFYWKEMLECVAAVHQHDVVHSDLKPANFLLVKGSLKLIDFGIANVIQDDTINVHREHQVGTPNFMAPEALTYANAEIAQPNGEGKLVKLGKPSDIWSLGCILYLMVYGEAPFAHCNSNLQKAMLITNPLHVITYPSTGIGGVRVPSGYIKTLKACLTWDQFQRPAIEALLGESYQLLYPDFETESKVAISQEHLGAILQSVIRHCRASGLPTDPEVATWQRIFYDKIRLTSAGETD